MNIACRCALLVVLALPGAAGAAGVPGTAADSQEKLTLEQVLSAPFPSDLVAAPSGAGNRVAWIFNSRGLRNIWMAEGSQFKARPLTNYAADDGQEISELEWSPDGRIVVYVRGGPKNQAGEIPNPTSDPAGAEQAVWAVSAAGGAPRRLGQGSSPAVSPAGDRVAFLRDGQVWVAPLSGASEATVLFKARGTAVSLAWSPEGSRLAFMSSRGDHSFVGVYDSRRNSVRYMAPSVDRDTEPRWSPDGKRIAFLRFAARGGASGFGDGDRDVRWGIWVADVASGEGREIWHAPAREGGSFSSWQSGDSLLQWAAGDRLVFVAELDGWNRLYSLPASGGEPVALSGPNCEVEDTSLTPERSSLVYSSNCGDIDRRHLWRVSVAEGPPSALTSGTGMEFRPQVVGGGTLVFLASDAHRPAALHVVPLSGGQPRAIAPETLPADLPSRELVEPQQAIFKAADGLEIHGQLFLPASAGRPAAPQATRLPAVIFVHGGPMRQMLLGWHNMYYYHNAYGLNQYLASRGYAVLSVNYRAGIGYGRAFRLAPKRGSRGASEYQDVVAAAQYLRGRADIDPARIGIWGGSYGGFLTALALARNSDLFAAGVDLHGVHDWSGSRSASLLPRDPAATQLARESSPVAAVKTWRSPVLLIHGDDDRNVQFAQTVELVARLREQNVEFEQMVYPDEVHDFLRHDHWLEAYRAACRFFDTHLKPKGASTR